MTPTSDTAPAHHTFRDIIAALFHPAVLVGALGYFVDVYDLILFAVVRIPSLKGLGISGDQLVTQGTGSSIGKTAASFSAELFGACSATALGASRPSSAPSSSIRSPTSPTASSRSMEGYTVCRFFAGLGLAGELGGCITLVAEVLPQVLRGYGTLMVSALGVLGAVAAAYVGLHFDWRTAYYIGGGLGLFLLVLRMASAESGLYSEMAKAPTRPPFGSQLLLLLSPGRLGRYLCCVLIGLPCWYVILLLILFSPEFAKALGASVEIKAPLSVAFGYAGICLGSLASGGLSQYLRSRKIVLALFITAAFLLTNIFFLLQRPSPELLYALIFCIGIAVGYWAIFVTVAAEHFGTNMRATVATTVPNFSRAAVIPISILFTWLKPQFGILHSGLALGWLVTRPSPSPAGSA